MKRKSLKARREYMRLKQREFIERLKKDPEKYKAFKEKRKKYNDEKYRSPRTDDQKKAAKERNKKLPCYFKALLKRRSKGEIEDFPEDLIYLTKAVVELKRERKKHGYVGASRSNHKDTPKTRKGIHCTSNRNCNGKAC